MKSNFSLFGICFDAACRDQQNAQANLVQAQASALAGLNSSTTQSDIGKYIAYGLGASALIIVAAIIITKTKK